MGKLRSAYDNAIAETFFSNLKKELIHGERFKTRKVATAAIFKHIEVFYNRKRMRSSFGYQSPVMYGRDVASHCSGKPDQISTHSSIVRKFGVYGQIINLSKVVFATRAAQFAPLLIEPSAFFIQAALKEELRNLGIEISILPASKTISSEKCQKIHFSVPIL